MKFLVIFSLIIFLVGCEKASFKDAALLNTRWLLSSIQDTKSNGITNAPNNFQGYIIFSDSLNTLMVGDGCNGCGSSYLILKNDSIKVTNLICSQAFCPSIDQWEENLFDNLGSACTYKIIGNHLTIYSKGLYNLNFTSE